MGSLVRLFKSRFKEVLDPYGFRASKGTFYRIISDVVQAVRLQKTKFDCTVEFGIWPLSDVIDDLSYWRGYDISKLRDGQMKGWAWELSPSTQYSKDERGMMNTIVFNDGSIEDIVEDMLSVFVKYILPLFEEATEFKNAMKIIKEYETSVYGEKSSEISDRRRYWWYILIGEYEEAVQRLNSLIEEAKSAMETKSNQYGRDKWIAESEKRLGLYKLKYEIVKSSDYKKTIMEVISGDCVDADVREQLLSNERFIKDYETMPYIQRQIRDTTRHLKQAEDADSAWSKELNKIEALYISGVRVVQNRISQMSDELALLLVRDIEYFQKIITENEAKSREYFSNPGKLKRKN